MKAQVMTGLFFAGAAFALFKYKNSPNRNDENETMNNSEKNHGFGFSASNLDWSQIKYFSESEFHGEAQYLDAAVVYELDKLRAKIGRIMVSPATGAVARERIGSQHDRSNGRLSVAVDIMPLDVDLETAYYAARDLVKIGGVGAYPEWMPHAGIHIDLRHRKSGGALAQWSDGDQSIFEAFA